MTRNQNKSKLSLLCGMKYAKYGIEPNRKKVFIRYRYSFGKSQGQGCGIWQFKIFIRWKWGRKSIVQLGNRECPALVAQVVDHSKIRHEYEGWALKSRHFLSQKLFLANTCSRTSFRVSKWILPPVHSRYLKC